MKFYIVWEDCIQEEARVANREALLREYDRALATHTKEEINQTSRRVNIAFKEEIPEKEEEEGLLKLSMLQLS